MLDLSVPWDTSDPVFRKLEGAAPRIQGRACAATNNGADLFVLSAGAGYTYNVKSSSWELFPNTNFATGTHGFAVTDPETGIIYLPDGGMSPTGTALMLSVNLKTKTVNTIGDSPYMVGQPVWNTNLKSMIVLTVVAAYGEMIFTPSKVTKSSDGWSPFTTTPETGVWDCGASAYGDSVMVFVGRTRGVVFGSTIYFLDVVKQTWREGPRVPKNVVGSSCAISGELFIIWGGSLNGTYADGSLGTYADSTLVFNIKTEEWVSRYIPSPPRQSPTQDTTTTSGSGDISSSDKRLVTIIVAVTGVLLAII